MGNYESNFENIEKEIRDLKEKIALLQMEENDLNFKWLIADSDCFDASASPETFDTAIEIYSRLMQIRKSLLIIKKKLNVLKGKLNVMYGNLLR